MSVSLLLSFRVSKHHGIWKGIALDQEKVVEFVFGIDRILEYNDQSHIIFGLVVEKNTLGVKVFDGFNKIFSRYARDIKIEAAGHEVIIHCGKPEFVGDPISFKKSAFHSLGLGIEKIGWEWKVYGEDRGQVIQDVEKYLGDPPTMSL